ncbi:MAG: hypothetical protein ACLFTU_00880 [Puniceicoccaceae bacterium]
MKHIEKIVFLLCLVLVAGLAASLFLGDGGARSADDVVPPVSREFTLADYEGLPPIPDAEWEPPEPRDSEGKWLYSVFTPPILYLVDDRFTVEPPEPPGPPPPPPPPPEPFGVRLVEMIRNQYRLQLDAVYETELGNIDSAVLSFENVYATETEGPTVSLKKGETHPTKNFRVEEIRKERREIGGGRETEHIATITDLESGKVYELSDLKTVYEEGVVFLFESTEDTGESARVSNVGDTFEMNDATYTLAEINLDPVSVELVKEADYLDVPESETLSPTGGSGAPTSGRAQPPPAPSPPSSDGDDTAFDGFFE